MPWIAKYHGLESENFPSKAKNCLFHPPQLTHSAMWKIYALMKTTKQMERKDIQRMVRRGISWTLILIALSVSAGVNTQEKQMEAGQVRVQKWIRLPDGSYSGNRSSTLRCETEQFKRQLGKFLFVGRSCPILCRWDVGQLIIVCLAYCNGHTHHFLFTHRNCFEGDVFYVERQQRCLQYYGICKSKENRGIEPATWISFWNWIGFAEILSREKLKFQSVLVCCLVLYHHSKATRVESMMRGGVPPFLLTFFH